MTRYEDDAETERWEIDKDRHEFQRAISKLMDDAPEWRDWLAWQLRLLDLEYDEFHWITTEWIRG